VAAPIRVFACALEWALPGAGYLVLGRIGRAATAFAGVSFLFGFGLYLDGALDRPIQNDLLSYFGTFAAMGSGVPYFVASGADSIRRGLGDLNSASFEYGTTFLRAAGLVGYLLILDVYDIAVGRKD
jgi:hypothetical protein